MVIEWNDFDSHLRSGVAEALDAAGIDGCRDDAPEPPAPVVPVELDAGLIAEGLGLAPARVPAMVADRRIATLCERGTGEEEGLFRFTFYYAGQRLRLVTDAKGRPITP
ncbi:MAG TPA: DUF6522 family protein [Arenimonas sp.]|nr:DUF6522 family protein [Arenimonas sp.]